MNAAPLWTWMRERHAIHERRAAGHPWPWTPDKILRDYRFCNVFRELDAVTKQFDELIRRPHARSPHLWFMLAIARVLNWPDTVRDLMANDAWPVDDSFDLERVRELLHARAARGDQVFTGAYIVPNLGMSTPKTDVVVDVFFRPLWQRAHGLRQEVEAATTLQAAHAALKPFRGWGPFLRYEWVSDLRHTRYLREATDVSTWACAGPGALRGLKRLRSPDGTIDPRPVNQAAACRMMRELLEQAPANLPAGFPRLEMREIEHSLCETDKYLRVVLNEGKLRSRYQRPA